MSQISIWPLRKTWLSTWWQNPCWQSQGQTFLVVGHQVCTHLRRDFVPLLFADPLQVIKVSRLTFVNSNLQLPSQLFYGMKIWRLSRPLQDLSVLLLEPLLCCLGRVFWVIVMLEYPSTTHFHCPGWLQCLALMVHGPVHRPFQAVLLSCLLSRKTPSKHDVSTSMFDGGDGVLGVIGSIPPPPNTASWVDAKELDFGLIWPQHFHPVLLWVIGTLQTGLYVCFLEQQDFSPSRRSVLAMVFLVSMVPAALRSLTRSSRVVLGWFLTVLMIHFFHLWIIAPTVVTFSPSCLEMVL